MLIISIIIKDVEVTLTKNPFLASIYKLFLMHELKRFMPPHKKFSNFFVR